MQILSIKKLKTVLGGLNAYNKAQHLGRGTAAGSVIGMITAGPIGAIIGALQGAYHQSLILIKQRKQPLNEPLYGSKMNYNGSWS
jgi:uncharacterized membrane protein